MGEKVLIIFQRKLILVQLEKSPYDTCVPAFRWHGTAGRGEHFGTIGSSLLNTVMF